MAKAKELKVHIGVNADAAIVTFGKVGTRLDAFEKGVKRVSKELGSFGSMATKALTLPIAGGATAFALATKEAKDFQKGMLEVKTLLPQLSKEGFEKLSKEANEFARKMGVMPEQVTSAMYQAISAGVPEENVFSFLETAAKNSIGGMTDLTTSVDGLTTATNIYGLENLSTQKASDIMFTTMRLGKTTVGELAQNIGVLAPAAEAAGVSFEEVGAAMATVTAQGRTTNVASTQLRAAINELSNEGSTTAKVFKSLSGMSFKNFIASGKTFSDALNLMYSSASKSGKSVENMFSSVEAKGAVLALTGEKAKLFSRNLDEMKNSVGATEQAFGEMDIGLDRQIERATAEIKSIVIEIGENLMPIVLNDLIPVFRENVVPLVERLAKVVGNLTKTFSYLPAPMKAVVLGGVGIAASVGPLSSVLSGLITNVQSAQKAFGAFKTAMLATEATAKIFNVTMAATPIGLIVALSAALVGVAIAANRQAEAERKLIDENNKLIDTQNRKVKNMREEYEYARGIAREFDTLASKTKRTREEQDKMNKLAKELKDIYPELTIEYKANGDAIEYNKDQLVDLNKARRDERSEINKQTITSADDEIMRITKETKAIQNRIDKRKEELAIQNSPPPDMYDDKDFDMDAWEKDMKKRAKDMSNSEIFDWQNQIKGLEQELTAAQARRRDAETESLKIKADKEKADKEEAALFAKRAKEKADAEAAAAKAGKNEKIKSFKEYMDEIKKQLSEYDNLVANNKELGIEMKDADARAARYKIVSNGIEEMGKKIKFTKEQAKEAKELLDDNKPLKNFEESFKKTFQSIADIADPILSQTNSIFSQMQQGMDAAVQKQIDDLERVKNATLKMNNIIVKSEREKYKDSMNQRRKDYNDDINKKKHRLQVVLGLYEREKLEKEIADLEAKNNELTEEEDKELKRLEIEEDFAKQKTKLEFDGAVRNWQLQTAQAQISFVQSLMGAVSAGMNSPFPPFFIPFYTAMATTLGGIQLAAIINAKPEMPELAEGGVIRRRLGGMSAIIGEGKHNEAVIPLRDDILEKIGNQMREATDKKERQNTTMQKERNDRNSTDEIIITQPLVLTINGKVVIDELMQASRRGIKIIDKKGIIGL